ncbi:MAG: CPBP family intramembrane metalloprotease [Anaerolineales bacterium]|nr:CPBP family intramembrane metalloprotease [Anaerolineales bacterium]
MKSIFSLSGTPWLFTFLFMLSWVACSILITMAWVLTLRLKSGSQIPTPWVPVLAHILTLFIVVPFVLGFPGKSHSYTAYLSEIRLTKVQPLLGLILLGLTCYLIMALSQAAGVLVYRLTQGLPIDGSFIRSSFVLANELPPRSNSWLQSVISIFEEMSWRGVVLALFLRFYDQPKAILFSALGFGLMHTLTLLDGRPPAWTAGMVVWATILGLFYGYVTVKTGSLLPAMLVHYLGNLFIAAINAYIQKNASLPVQAVYGVVFTLGIIPTVLMMFWTRLFTTWWPLIQKP